MRVRQMYDFEEQPETHSVPLDLEKCYRMGILKRPEDDDLSLEKAANQLREIFPEVVKYIEDKARDGDK